MNTTSGRDLDGVVVLRRELIADGLNDRQIAAKVHDGELYRVRHGSYVSGPLWSGLTPADRHRVLVRAVMRRAAPGAVVSHVSAAVEHGAPVWGIPLDEVHLTRLDGMSGRREAGIARHAGLIEERDVDVVNGIMVTGPARCAVEVTTMTTVEPALVTVNGLLHSGLISTSELAAEIDRRKHWPDTLATTIVQRLCDPRVQSVAESRTLFLCWDQHLPRPEPQVPIIDESGRAFAYADFAWKEAGVFLEFDGRLKYRMFRRANETLEQFVLREKRREELICQLTGWVCIRITWADLENPVRTAQRIRRILDSRRSPMGA
jgi:hypothetical protein